MPLLIIRENILLSPTFCCPPLHSDNNVQTNPRIALNLRTGWFWIRNPPRIRSPPRNHPRIRNPPRIRYPLLLHSLIQITMCKPTNRRIALNLHARWFWIGNPEPEVTNWNILLVNYLQDTYLEVAN